MVLCRKIISTKIEGFNTSNYTDLKLTYQITGNKAGTADLLLVKCGEQLIEVPQTNFEQNSYVEIQLSNLTPGFTSIEFKSEENINTIGLRLDNVKLTGILN